MKIDIYTDASINTNFTRISAFVIDEHENEYCYNESVNIDYLGTRFSHNNQTLPKDDISIFEMYAIWAILNKFKKIENLKMTIYTDCHSSFLFLNGLAKIKPRRALHSSILKGIKELNMNVEFRWIKGHAGVYGNNKADCLTRHRISFLRGITIDPLVKKLNATL